MNEGTTWQLASARRGRTATVRRFVVAVICARFGWGVNAAAACPPEEEMKRRHRHLKLIALALVAAAMVVPAAGAGPASVSNLLAISAGGPLATPCSTDTAEWTADIAVNPRNRENLIAAWNQGFAQAVVVGVSQDGGKTWEEVAPPGLSTCSLGPGTGTADPRVAFAADGGTAFLSLERFAGPLLPPSVPDEVVVSRSTDGGRTWSAFPTVIPGSSDPAEGHNGEATITTHPEDARRAYVVWSKHGLCEPPEFVLRQVFGVKGGDIPGCDAASPWSVYFSKTEDGGESWSTARKIYAAPTDVFPIFGEIRVLRDGTLLDVFLQYDNNGAELRAMRSEDDGKSWTLISESIAEVKDVKAIGETHTPAFDVAPDGTAYVAWHEILRDAEERVESSKIRISKSSDGGKSWTELNPVKTEVPHLCGGEPRRPEAFLPTLAVANDGTIGVTYYDFRDDCPSDDERTANVWFAHSHDGGRSWRETRLAEPFDLNSALFIGYYFGLAAAQDGFAAAFVQAEPGAAEPPTDVFFAHIGATRGNRVKNGGFEHPNAEGTGPADWSAHDTAAGTNSWSDGGIDGSTTVTISGAGGSALLAGSPTWTSDPITVTPGETLDLVVSVKAGSLSSSATAGLAYLDADGRLLNAVTLIAAPLRSAAFVQLTEAVTIPPGVDRVRVVLSGFAATDLATAGTITYDDVGLFAR